MSDSPDQPEDRIGEGRNESASGLDEHVDEALEAMWRGESEPLENLVGEEQGSGSGVGRLLKEMMNLSPVSLAEQELPHQIDQYTIIRVLGEGGMGVVYEARQEHPCRSVALKVIRGAGAAGRVDNHMLRLFQREVQTLARLEHPGIAAIHEAGRTETGQHFFAMELVQGVPLNSFVQDGGLSTDDRLRLFLRVCGAIQFAHQRGVIHRDLKPTNILVDAEGSPKVLDFGLAKITDVDITVTTIETEAGKIQGTLPYMSPEQARGDPREVNLLSDVYALGVILYELLTDRLPYQIRGAALPEALRVICDQAPNRPSTIRRGLRGDLETIVLKALEKDADRRYQSAAALAEDVERYLTSQPILARPPSATYQLRKLIARHKAPSALLASLFVLVSASAIWMGLMYREADRLRISAETAHHSEQAQRRFAEEHLVRAEEAERESRIEARTAERISQFLQDMLASADPERMRRNDVTVGEALAHATHEIDTVLADEPDVEMAVRGVIGKTYKNLGRFSEAEEQLRRALALAKTSHEDGLADRRPELARIMLDLGKALANQDRFDEAESTYENAIALLIDSVGEAHPDAIRGLAWIGMLRWKQGRYEEAEEDLRAAHDGLREALGADNPDTIAAANDLALILNDRGKYADAEPLFRMLLDNTLATLGETHPQAGRAFNNLAWNLHRAGRYVEAQANYERAIATWSSSLGDTHPETTLGRGNLGQVLILRGKFEDAVEVLRGALEVNRDILGERHTQTAGCCVGLAWALHELGRHEEAEPLIETALSTLRQTVGEAHYSLANAYEVKGRGLILQQRFPEAEVPIRSALSVRQGVLDKDHPDTTRLYNELAFVLSKQNKYDEAEPLFRQALDAYVRTLGPEHHGTLAPMHNVASVLEKQGKADEAAPIYRQVVALAEKILPAGHWNTAVFHGSFGNCLLELGEYQDAELHLTLAVDGLATALGDEHPRTRHFRQKLTTLQQVGTGGIDRDE